MNQNKSRSISLFDTSFIMPHFEHFQYWRNPNFVSWVCRVVSLQRKQNLSLSSIHPLPELFRIIFCLPVMPFRFLLTQWRSRTPRGMQLRLEERTMSAEQGSPCQPSLGLPFLSLFPIVRTKLPFYSPSCSSCL